MTGQPLASISSGDAMRWGISWKGEPPLLQQIRDILADIAVNTRYARGDDSARHDQYIITRAEPEPAPKVDPDILNYFTKYGTVSHDGIQH